MIKTIKICLFPIVKQVKSLIRMANLARGIYNNYVEIYRKNLECEIDNIFINLGETKGYSRKTDTYRFFLNKYNIRKVQQEYCNKNEELKWVLGENTGFIRSVVGDDFLFSLKKTNFPEFKSKKRSRLSIPIRCDSNKGRLSRIYLKSKNRVQIPTIGAIKISNKLNKEYLDFINGKKQTARVVFDGKHWVLVFSIRLPDIEKVQFYNPIGIDLGLDKYATISDGTYYSNFNKNSKKIDLENRIKFLQRKRSKKYALNGKKISNNQIKVQKRINILQRRLNNIRKNTKIEIAIDILKRTNPSTIVMESLNIKGMLKNKYLSKSISKAGWYDFKQILINQCEKRGISFKEANTFYKSSKTCSKCGNIKPMPLNLRIYECPVCGNVLDRDVNAARNLMKLA